VEIKDILHKAPSTRFFEWNSQLVQASCCQRSADIIYHIWRISL